MGIMSVNPVVSLQTLSAADGFLAGLIYLSATKQATTPNSFTPTVQSWRCLEGIWANLGSVQTHILELAPRLGLSGIDDTLDSFFSPVLFFKAAVLSLRNALIGQPPSTLGDVVALFCLSHVVSRHLRSSHISGISDTQLDIGQWGNAIRRYDHRQAFASLVRALFPEITTPVPHSSFLDPATVDYNNALHFTAMYQDAPFELPPPEVDLIEFHLENIDASPNLLNLIGSQLTGQEAHSDRYTFVGETGFQTLVPLDPHGSALVNFTLFLEQCGNLFQNLSGRWVTAKHQYAPLSALNQARVQNNDVSSYLQRLRRDELFQDPSLIGILCIVDTFVQLGYLQTPEDVQDYMIIAGKEILPDREYVKYCPLVVNALGMASPPGSRSPSTPRPAGSEQRKFACSMCRRRFTRKSNMQRHRNSVHKHEHGSVCLTGPTIKDNML